LQNFQDNLSRQQRSRNNSSVPYCDIRIGGGGRFESMSSLDCGNKVNLEEEADIYEVPQEFEENFP